MTNVDAASERRLVTVERIAALTPIPDADAIEAATIRGWTVVVKKGEFVVGDEVVYFEIDSFLPLSDERFAFLAPRGEKAVGGVRGHVLRTARLRGTYSQGLALPVGDFPELSSSAGLAATLGIVKYEPPIPASLTGRIVGALPSHLPKTDAERVQNLADVFGQLRTRYSWTATEKIDGTSITYINDDGRLRVCGRNWELAEPSNAESVTPWRVGASIGILDRLPVGHAVQGELFGIGIQGNPLRISDVRYAVFGVLVDGRYLPRAEWPATLTDLAVPVLDLTLAESVGDAVAQADGLRSAIAPERLAEGIVWHAVSAHVEELGRRSCFKVINNKWLLKHG